MKINQPYQINCDNQGNYHTLVDFFECVYDGRWLIFSAPDAEKPLVLYGHFETYMFIDLHVQNNSYTGISYDELKPGFFYEIKNSAYLQQMATRGTSSSVVDYTNYKHLVLVTEQCIFEAVAEQFPLIVLDSPCEHYCDER